MCSLNLWVIEVMHWAWRWMLSKRCALCCRLWGFWIFFLRRHSIYLFSAYETLPTRNACSRKLTLEQRGVPPVSPERIQAMLTKKHQNGSRQQWDVVFQTWYHCQNLSPFSRSSNMDIFRREWAVGISLITIIQDLQFELQVPTVLHPPFSYPVQRQVF